LTKSQDAWVLLNNQEQIARNYTTIMTDTLNLEALTTDAYIKLQRLDKTLVRTPDYMGLAYFWHHDFRFHLRDASYAKRRKIHNQWLKQGIDFDHPCDAAWNIVRKITGLN